MRFLNFSRAFGSSFYPERVENTSTESIIFKCASVVAPPAREGRQRQKFMRLLFIRGRFQVLVERHAALGAHCDDHV